MLYRKTLQLICALTALLGVGASLVAKNDETVRKLFASTLANVPGQTLTAEVVEYPPGGKSEAHSHAGSVFAYVLTGGIRSQNSATGPASVYKAGEWFFEPAGSEHSISENASASEPARLLAIHVAKDGAVLTRFGHTK